MIKCHQIKHPNAELDYSRKTTDVMRHGFFKFYSLSDRFGLFSIYLTEIICKANKKQGRTDNFFFLDAPTINSRRETSLFKLTSHRMIVDVLNGKITRINPNSFLVRDFKLELLF